MANQEHLDLLSQGREIWDSWRLKDPNIWPDLSSADLRESIYLLGLCANLSYANLSRANLKGVYLIDPNFVHTFLNQADLSNAFLNQANFTGADLSHANLSCTHLTRADLSRANLINADLSDADLGSTDLSGANLSGANLEGANLSRTNLSQADLSGANLSRSFIINANLSRANLRFTNLHAIRLADTNFAWVDLCSVDGLESIIHTGPSSVDVKTVTLPQGNLRTHFLRGAGFPDNIIDSLPSLLTIATQYASCFISYAHQDEALARRLYKDLQDKGVRCWMAPHDLRPGDYHHSRIDEAIRIHEKILLLLSEHAMNSSWVKHEVQIAEAREIKQDCTILFPLRLDEGVMQTSKDWAVRLRESRHIGDFTLWENDTIYQQHLANLLRDLKTDTPSSRSKTSENS